jgi:hypothetical protein
LSDAPEIGSCGSKHFLAGEAINVGKGEFSGRLRRGRSRKQRQLKVNKSPAGRLVGSAEVLDGFAALPRTSPFGRVEDGRGRLGPVASTQFPLIEFPESGCRLASPQGLQRGSPGQAPVVFASEVDALHFVRDGRNEMLQFAKCEAAN